METKTCKKCGEVKGVELFNKDKSRLDGLYCWCKLCSSESCKRIYQENKERYRELSKKSYQENKEKVKERYEIYKKNPLFYEQRKEYRQKNKFKNDPIRKEWRLKNKEKVVEYRKKSFLKNKEKAMQGIRKRFKKSVLVLAESYVLKNIVKKTGLSREALKKHPDLAEIERLIIKTRRAIKSPNN